MQGYQLQHIPTVPPGERLGPPSADSHKASLRSSEGKSAELPTYFSSPQGDSGLHSVAQEQPVTMPEQITLVQVAFIVNSDDDKATTTIGHGK